MPWRWLSVAVLILVANHTPCWSFDYANADRLAARLPIDGIVAMVSRGNCLYIAKSGALQVYDIGVAGAPTLVATCAIPTGYTRALSVDGNLLFLQSTARTLLVALDDPWNPRVLADVNGIGAVALFRERLLVGGSSRPRVYDLSVREAPVELAPLDVYGTLLGKLGNDLLTMSQHEGPVEMLHELRLSRRALTESYTLGDSVTVYSNFLSYSTWHAPGALQKVTDRVRLQLNWTYTDYDSGCRLGPCVYTGASDWDFFDSNPDRRSGAQSIAMSYPDGFLAAGAQYDFGILAAGGCSDRYLNGTPRLDAPPGRSPFVMRACTSGLVCAAGTRLFVAAGGILRMYEFGSLARADTTHIYTVGTETLMSRPSRAGNREAWLEDTQVCVPVSSPDGTWYEAYYHRYLAVMDLDGGIRLNSRPLVNNGYSWAYRTAALCDESRYVVSTASISYPSLGNWSLQFYALDGALPFATIDGVGAQFLLPAGVSLLAASGTTLSVVDISDPQAPLPGGALILPSSASGLFRWTGGAAVAGTSSGLTLVEPLTASDWRVVATIPTEAAVTAVESRGTQLILASGSSLLTYDLSESAVPTLADSFSVGAPVSGFATSGSYVYAACGNDGLLVCERIAGAAPRYVGGYPYDAVSDVRIEDGRLLAATSQGLISLPLQDGDPLPAYRPELSAVVDERGQPTLEWPAADRFGFACRLFRVQGAERLELPFVTVEGRCVARDEGVAGLSVATYVLMASSDEVHWFEAGRAVVDLRAGATQLLPAWPNPANLGTIIQYRLAADGPVRLAIYDLAGRRLRLLVDQREYRGMREAAWDGRDDAGRGVAAGLYVMKLEAGGQVRTGKLAVVR